MTTYRKPARLFQTDETFDITGTHRIGVAVYHTTKDQWTWGHACALPGGHYGIALNRSSGARRYLKVASEAAAWEYLNDWARTTRGFDKGTLGMPAFLTSARLDINVKAAAL